MMQARTGLTLVDIRLGWLDCENFVLGDDYCSKVSASHFRKRLHHLEEREAPLRLFFVKRNLIFYVMCQ